ncbi:MAG TPA: beta-ketoacyl-ACP synthase III [Acidisoma sp.]|uniref:beta-ketoacyl-ACP synthase III n=1 Tax=Acidisoma sp. TaxID=1872115 RepID=UPI002C4C80F4|nr:beta-ketoacyl-ACP synthase III [Acidisoma sp.]HTI00123.1 beta-ketoacyl-ACP synthase III [Acidisoma sp.]
MIRSVLAGAGGYLPGRVVSNDEMAALVDTSDAWIRERTGIHQRYRAEGEETTTSMAVIAGRRALEMAGATAAEVDLIIVATSTPDQAFPSVAVRVQAGLGVDHGFGFDVSAACAGFVYALSIADEMIRAGRARGALIIGSEVFSRILDYGDRGTCVLFGDGAGAVFLRAAEGDGAQGVLSTHLHAQGSLGDILYVDGAVGVTDAAGAPMPGKLRMHGREVFRHAVQRLSESVEEALAANGLAHDAVDWLVPHQANIRIIEGMGRKLGLAPERVVITVDRHANTSAASIPLALAEAMGDGRIQHGQLVLMEALGGGLVWGSALVRI